MKNMEKEKVINVITLGDSGVGKTSIIQRFKDDTFSDDKNVTLGIDVIVLKRKFENRDLTISLNIHDTAGQEVYKSMPLNYIRNSHIVLLVFSNIKTLDEIKNRWLNLYKKHSNVENSIFIIVGNKSDIFGDQRDEIIKQGKQFAEKLDAYFITCSAKNKDNMDNLENYIVTEAKRFIKEEEKMQKYSNDKNNNKEIIIDKQSVKNKKSNCKC